MKTTHARWLIGTLLLTTSACGMGGQSLTPATPVSSAVVARIAIGDFATDVAVRADGARAYATLRTGKVIAIDTASRQVAGTIVTDGQPGAIALTPDGARGYVMDMTAQNVFVLDTTNAQLLQRIPVGIIARPIMTPAVAVSRDGRRAYVTNATSQDDHLLVVDTASNSIVKDQFLGIHPTGVAVSPDGTRVYVAGCKLACIDGTLLVLDAATATVQSQIALATPPTGIVLAPDGARAYLANGRAASASIVDLATTNVTTVTVGAQPLGVAIDPQGRFAYVASFGDDRIDVIDTATTAVRTSIAVADQPRAIAVSPDGRLAYVTHTSSQCSVIDLTRVVGK